MRVFDLYLKKQMPLKFKWVILLIQINTYEQVYIQIKEYFMRIEEEAQKKNEDQNQQMNENEIGIRRENKKLQEQKVLYQKIRKIIQKIYKRRIRKEQQELEGQILKEVQQLRTENAIKLIQYGLIKRKEQYGLGVKQKKPKKPKK